MQFDTRLAHWHRWWAWRPVALEPTLDTNGNGLVRRWVWLEWVERRDLYGSGLHDYRPLGTLAQPP